MKLYPVNTTITRTHLDGMNEFKHREISYLLLFTLNGIIQVDNKKTRLLKIIDSPVKHIYLNNIKFICDESKYIFECEWFQIPKNHVAKHVKKTYYRNRPKSLVELVVETNQNSNGVCGTPLVYFVSKISNISQEIETDIFSLLTALKSRTSY